MWLETPLRRTNPLMILSKDRPPSPMLLPSQKTITRVLLHMVMSHSMICVWLSRFVPVQYETQMVFAFESSLVLGFLFVWFMNCNH